MYGNCEEYKDYCSGDPDIKENCKKTCGTCKEGTFAIQKIHLLAHYVTKTIRLMSIISDNLMLQFQASHVTIVLLPKDNAVFMSLILNTA